ncbi:TadE/TadG family type IV pilus assembly protein [Sneathiella limimaris]|uniref:TadE/TadG family type IV pilus assembly protein n=1 Tax=Sneathiella limimaris TaxID=1964213 RepID=UPI00146BA682|nr:TadE/TadG family type IV pilus assembly protein [Sneathiella limimaris]
MKKLIQKIGATQVGSFAKGFIANCSGVAMTEFAMLLPLIFLIAVGSFEVSRYALMTQKMDRISATVADLVARDEALTAAEMDNLLDSIEHLASPFEFDGLGMVVVTSVVGRDGKDPLIIGQKSKGSLADKSSLIGSNGGTAKLPAVFTDQDGQTLENDEGLIVTEVFYKFSPFFAGAGGSYIADDFLSGIDIYRQSFFRPRFSERTTFE